jgi:hypothetical protein
MFEVFAGFCFFTAMGLTQCDDYVIESYDDPLSCEIAATGYRREDHRFINPACIPSPEVEPMP